MPATASCPASSRAGSPARTGRPRSKYANACGAFAVSRHGCTPAYPSWEELQFFLNRGIRTPALRHDAELEQIHWSTNRLHDWPELRVFAFDHRMQLEGIADEPGCSPATASAASSDLCLEAAQKVAAGRPGYGILCDGRLGRDALYAAAGTGLWIGRPVEDPGTRPLRLEIEPDYGSALAEWPLEHVVKVLCFYHPDDTPAMKADQEATLTRLFRATRANRLELLLEIIPSKVAPVDDTTAATLIDRFYALGVFPDWWKLEPMTSDAAWANATAAITRHDPYCRGIIVLGLDAPIEDLAKSFSVAARHPLVKGFAIGRTIFAETARRWLAGAITDAEATAEMARKYDRLCRLWDEARTRKGDAA